MDLTFREGKDIDLAKSTVRAEVDHLDEVVLLILIVVREARAHVDKVNLSTLEGSYFGLHVQVLVQREVLRVEHGEGIADLLEGISHVFIVDWLSVGRGHFIHSVMVGGSVRGFLQLKLIFLLLVRGLVTRLLLHLKQIVSRDFDPEVGPLVLDKAFQTLANHLMIIHML